MKKTFILLLLSLSCFSLNAQKIDATAIERFFEITDSLRLGKPISQEKWEAFLSLKGNSQYIRNQQYSIKYLEKLRKDLEVVFLPQHDSLLKKRLENPQQHYNTYILHYYKANEPELRAYLAEILANRSSYLNAMYRHTYSMLPKRLQGRSEDATIYLIGLSNDAVASEGDIILTLWGNYVYDKVRYGILGGHELHHLLSKNKFEVPKKYESLFTLLQMLVNEGAPDLIDKGYTMSPEMPEEMRYGEYMLQKGEKNLPLVDEAIQRMAESGESLSRTEIGHQVLSMSGHIPGFYMASVIDRNGLTKKLVEGIDNPFLFIYLYNKAAKKDKKNPYIFSKDTITYLKKVEKEVKRMI